jgi:hypothetical protein
LTREKVWDDNFGEFGEKMLSRLSSGLVASNGAGKGIT